MRLINRLIKICIGCISLVVFKKNDTVSFVSLMHSVSNKNTSLTYSPDKLESFIKYFLSKGFMFISILDIKKHHYRKAIALTFDDGYLDNYTVLNDILIKYNVPATIYVATGFIDSLFTDSCFNTYKIMNNDQLKELSNNNLITIGAHTVNHKNLIELTKNEQFFEINGSIEYLEQLIGKKIHTFAYPKGKYNNNTLEIVKKLKLHCPTVEYGVYINDDTVDCARIKRINITNNLSYIDYILISTGRFNNYLKLKNLIRRSKCNA